MVAVKLGLARALANSSSFQMMFYFFKSLENSLLGLLPVALFLTSHFIYFPSVLHSEEANRLLICTCTISFLFKQVITLN